MDELGNIAEKIKTKDDEDLIGRKIRFINKFYQENAGQFLGKHERFIDLKKKYNELKGGDGYSEGSFEKFGKGEFGCKDPLKRSRKIAQLILCLSEFLGLEQTLFFEQHIGTGEEETQFRQVLLKGGWVAKDIQRTNSICSNIGSKFPPPLKNDYFPFTPAEKVLQIELVNPEFKTSEFFRKTGPTYIDIKEEKVFIRDEVKAVVEFLENKESVLVTDNSASGKTVLSRIVSVQLMERKKHVLFLDLKKDGKNLNLRNLLDKIEKLMEESENAIVIIEDAHLKSQVINRFLSAKKHKWPVFLILSRNSYKHAISKEEVNYFESFPQITLQSDESIEGIVKKFVNSDSHISIDKLKKITGNNLWLLSYALKGLNNENINENNIKSEVKRDLEKIADQDPLYVRILIALSIFYRNETPTDIRFLYEIFPETPNEIESSFIDLLKMGEINKIPNRSGKSTLYGLPHSSLANIYFLFFEDSHWQINQSINDEEAYLIAYFLSNDTGNWFQLFQSFNDLKNFQLFQKIFRDKSKIIQMSSKISRTADIIDSCKFLSELSYLSDDFLKQLWPHIQKTEFIKKILECNDINRIIECLVNLSRCPRKIVQDLLEVANLNHLVVLFDKTDKLNQLARFLDKLRECHSGISRELCTKINIMLLVDKLSHFGFSEVSRMVLANLIKSNKSIGNSLCNKIDFEFLSKSLTQKNDLKLLAKWVDTLNHCDKSHAENVCYSIGLNTAKTLLNSSESLHDKTDFIISFSNVLPRYKSSLWKEIGLDKLAFQLIKNNVPIEIFRYCKKLHQHAEDIWKTLIRGINANQLATKIDNNDEPGHNILCIDYFSEVRPDLGISLWRSLSIKALAIKISDHKNISDIINVLNDISLGALGKIHSKAINELWPVLNHKVIAKKVIDEGNDYEIERLIEIAFQISNQDGKSFIQHIDVNILVEKTILEYGKLGPPGYIETLLKHSKKFQSKIYDKNTFSRIINQIFLCKNISVVGERIRQSFEISTEFGDKLWGHIDKQKIIECQSNSHDISSVINFIGHINKGSKSRCKEIWDVIDQQSIFVNTTKSISTVGLNINKLFTASMMIGGDIWNRINKKRLANEILTLSAYEIRASIEWIGNVSTKAVNQLIKELNTKKLVEIFSGSDDISNSLLCLRKINNYSQIQGTEILRSIDFTTFFSHILDNGTLEHLSDFMELMVNENELEDSESPFQPFDIQKLTDRLNDSADLFYIGKCINQIFIIDEEIGGDVWGALDIHKLCKKILYPTDESYAAKSVRFICQCSQTSASELISFLDESKIIEKFNEKSDISNLFLYLEAFCYSSEEVGMKLWQQVDIDKFTYSVKDEGLSYFCFLLNELHTVSDAVGEQIWNSVNTILSLHIQNSDKPYEVLGCMRHLLVTSKTIGDHVWINIVESEIIDHFNKSNLTDMRFFLINLFSYSRKAGIDFMNKIDKSQIINKINGSDDLFAVGLFLESLFNTFNQFGNDLFPGIDLELLAIKIRNSNEPFSSRRCFDAIFRTSPGTGDNLLRLISNLSPDFVKWNFVSYNLQTE